MKKLLFIFTLFVVISTNVFSQEVFQYKAVEINYKVEKSNWTGWYDTNILVEMIPATHKLVLYTDSPRIIDYGPVRQMDYKTYELIYTEGTDTEYDSVKVEWYFYKSGIIILKLYKEGVTVKYNLHLLK